jgi:hypothetical protein
MALCNGLWHIGSRLLRLIIFSHGIPSDRSPSSLHGFLLLHKTVFELINPFSSLGSTGHVKSSLAPHNVALELIRSNIVASFSLLKLAKYVLELWLLLWPSVFGNFSFS